MKKILKLNLIVTAAFFVIWIIAAIIFVCTNKFPETLPRGFAVAIFLLFSEWLLVGILALLINFKSVKSEIIKFINE